MARRAAIPVASPAKQAGSKTTLIIKKLPTAIGWVTLIFALIGAALGMAVGFFGNFLHGISPVIPGFWLFFKLGFVFGFGGIIVLYLRFSGFEDVQEGGRAYFASVGIGTCAAVAFSVFLPRLEGHDTLQSFFIGGIAIAAIMAIANIFLKDDYLRVVKWGAMLAGVALVGLIAIKATDGKGFDIHIKWPWGKSAAEERVPKDVWLSKSSSVLYFNNVSWETSDTYRVSSTSSGFNWEFAEDSACGTVLVNGRYPLRNLCPGRPGERIALEKSVLFPGEVTSQLQFIGKGMRGKVIATW